MIKNRYIRAFIAGSAFPVIIWPFLYFGYSSILRPDSGFNMGLMAIVVPFILGFADVIYLFTEEKWPAKSPNTRLLVVGGSYGLLLSIYGVFIAHLPERLFNLTGVWQYIMVPLAVVIYALIWRYIVKQLNILMRVR